MTGLKATKRALISSVIALFLCFAMLLGTTYAWFTDSATSAGNTITTGTLDVELYKWTDATTSVGLSQLAKDDPNADTSVFNAAVLWEPGHTEVAYLSIKNNGSLALKYRVAVVVTSASIPEMTEVMSYEITPDARYGAVQAWDGRNAHNVVLGTNATDAEDVRLLAGDEHFFALSVHMDEEAGNKFMNQSIIFDIKVLAGQEAYEEDSFGPNYDKDASYAGIDVATVVPGTSAYELEVRDVNETKIASATVPSGAVAADSDEVKIYVDDSTYKANITVATGMETKAVDVKVTGLKENNDVPVKVNLRLDAGLDPATVKLYHYDTEISSVYDPNTGYVTFETTTFSPFTLVYDAESEYVPPVVPPVTDAEMTIPTATVTYASEHVNVDLPWENYGDWSPTEGLDSQLEAAFVFKCPETLADEVRAAYENWYCDFFVSLDRDLGENQIFLGGNYGDFGWIGFHNRDLTLAANTEIGLLTSVTTNPWTYANIESAVGTFICGVGDVDDALDGATFTVKLRLIDPSKVDTSVSEWWTNLPEGSYVDVNVVTYTFGGDYNIQ